MLHLELLIFHKWQWLWMNYIETHIIPPVSVGSGNAPLQPDIIIVICDSNRNGSLRRKMYIYVIVMPSASIRSWRMWQFEMSMNVHALGYGAGAGKWKKKNDNVLRLCLIAVMIILQFDLLNTTRCDSDESIINLNSIKNPTAGGDNFSGLD